MCPDLGVRRLGGPVHLCNRTCSGQWVALLGHILPTVETPSPERGVFRWAWRRAARRRAQFWVATVIFSAVLSAITAFIVLPPNLTLVQKVLGALTALGAATVAVVASTYILALMAAPYQQRNALRRTVSELQASVSREHAHRLRQLAANLKNSLDSARAPDFGRDGDTWEQAFGEHFPQIRPLLEILAGKPGAFYALHGRLMREAHAAGMCEPPWLLVEFGMPLARMIERHCMVTILPISFSFD